MRPHLDLALFGLGQGLLFEFEILERGKQSSEQDPADPAAI
jgi:hypothetical protein